MCILLKRLLACWGCSLAILASAQARITVINRSLSTWTLRGAGTGPTAQCLVRLDGTGLGIGSSYTPGPADPLPLLPGLACDLTWDTPAGIVAFTLHDKTAGDSNPFLVNLVAHWGVAPRQGPSQMSLEVFSLASRYALRPADIQQKLGTLDGSGFIIHGESYQVFQGASLVQQMLTLLARNVPLLPMGAGAPRADRSPLPATPGSLPSLDGASVASKEESAASPGAPMDLEPAPSAGAGSRKRPRGEDRAEGPARKRARKEAKAPVAEDPFASDADDSDSPPAAGAARSRRNGSRQSIHIRNESGEAWTLRAALRKDVAVETRPNAEGQGGPETSTWATARKKMKPDVEVAFTIADGTTAKFDLSAPSNRIRRGEVDRLCFFPRAGADGAAAAGARFQVESVIVRVGEASAGGEPARGGKVKRTLPRILLDQTSPAFAWLALGALDTAEATRLQLLHCSPFPL